MRESDWEVAGADLLPGWQGLVVVCVKEDFSAEQGLDPGRYGVEGESQQLFPECKWYLQVTLPLLKAYNPFLRK